MLLSLSQMQDLAARCAPTVAAETLLSVAQVESAFDPLAINVNGAPKISVQAENPHDAAEKAAGFIAQGRSVDLGVLQINSRNLSRLGLTVEDAFDPCRNIAAAGQLLTENYQRSNAGIRGEQAALKVALSYYNTGDPGRGFRNGYVAKVTGAAHQIVPAIAADAAASAPAETATPAAAPASWDVFPATPKPASFVLEVSADQSTEKARESQ